MSLAKPEIREKMLDLIASGASVNQIAEAMVADVPNIRPTDIKAFRQHNRDAISGRVTQRARELLSHTSRKEGTFVISELDNVASELRDLMSEYAAIGDGLKAARVVETYLKTIRLMQELMGNLQKEVRVHNPILEAMQNGTAEERRALSTLYNKMLEVVHGKCRPEDVIDAEFSIEGVKDDG